MLRLIGFILVLGILLCFIGFNIEHVCNISFGPSSVKILTLHNVPVYLTIIAAFLGGMLCSVPFIIRAGMKKPARAGKEKNAPKTKKVKGKKDEETGSGPESGNFSDGGPYGID